MSDKMYLKPFEPDNTPADYPQCFYSMCINPAEFKVNIRYPSGSSPVGQIYFCEYHRQFAEKEKNNFYIHVADVQENFCLTDIPPKRTNLNMYIDAPPAKIV